MWVSVGLAVGLTIVTIFTMFENVNLEGYLINVIYEDFQKVEVLITVTMTTQCFILILTAIYAANCEHVVVRAIYQQGVDLLILSIVVLCALKLLTQCDPNANWIIFSVSFLYWIYVLLSKILSDYGFTYITAIDCNRLVVSEKSYWRRFCFSEIYYHTAKVLSFNSILQLCTLTIVVLWIVIQSVDS